MYGLDDSGRNWYKTIEAELLKLGCGTVFGDRAFFYYQVEGRLCGLISMHVDDIQHSGNDKFYREVMNKVFERYKFGSHQSGEYKVLGWNIYHKDNCIFINQRDYIMNKIRPLEIEKGYNPTTALLTDDQKSIMRGHVGKMRWLSDQTRPDVSYANLELSVMQNKATYREVDIMKKMINQVTTKELTLKYPRLPGNVWYITVFTDHVIW